MVMCRCEEAIADEAISQTSTTVESAASARAIPTRRRLSPGAPVPIGHGDVSLRGGDIRRSNLANKYDGGEHGSGEHLGRPHVVVQISPLGIESIDEVHLFLPR